MELKREVVEVSAFGYDKNELLEKLKTERKFSAEFMEQFQVVVELVKEYQNHTKNEEKTARALVKEEKESAERARLREVIEKIRENDPKMVLEPESIEESSIKNLKKWVKDYRASVKAAKEAEKQAKLDAKEAKEAAKQAKLTAKREKQIAQMEKMEADLKKWNDKVEFEVLSFIGKLEKPDDHFKEMKAYHTRIKFLVQIAKFTENVEGVPEYNEETIEDGDLKEMHSRCKILNQLTKLDNPIDYGTEMTIEALKEAVVSAKTAVAN